MLADDVQDCYAIVYGAATRLGGVLDFYNWFMAGKYDVVLSHCSAECVLLQCLSYVGYITMEVVLNMKVRKQSLRVTY